MTYFEMIWVLENEVAILEQQQDKARSMSAAIKFGDRINSLTTIIEFLRKENFIKLTEHQEAARK